MEVAGAELVDGSAWGGTGPPLARRADSLAGRCLPSCAVLDTEPYVESALA